MIIGGRRWESGHLWRSSSMATIGVPKNEVWLLKDTEKLKDIITSGMGYQWHSFQPIGSPSVIALATASGKLNLDLWSFFAVFLYNPGCSQRRPMPGISCPNTTLNLDALRFSQPKQHQ